jgi:protein gp37
LGYTTDAWWEAEEYQSSRRRSDERIAATAQAVKDARTIEIEEIAKEWAKREYFRASMAGTVENDMTEEEYILSVWDRAMLEGDMKFRQSKGEMVDSSTELATFQGQQERKQQVILKRAKAELAQVLQEDTGPDSDSPSDKDSDDEDDDE